AETVGRQFEFFGSVAAVNFSHPRQMREVMENVELTPRADPGGKMNDCKRTERAVMNHIGISYRQDNAEARTIFFHQLTFEIDDIWRTVRLLLRVHAVVGGDADGRAKFKEPPELLVDGGIEIERIWL